MRVILVHPLLSIKSRLTDKISIRTNAFWRFTLADEITANLSRMSKWIS